MESKPNISIVVPVYNDGQYLRKCLNSILNQTFTNIEVIIVNDGSTDDSRLICDEYAKDDNRVKLVNQEKQGVSEARNVGISLAKGDFIGFVDGDDYIRKNMIENLYKACLHRDSDISICKLGREIDNKIVNDDKEYYRLELSNIQAMEELFKGILYRFSLCNKLFRKKCFTGVSFPVGRIHEDLSTTYKLFANANKVTYLNFIGYVYVKHPNSILTTPYYDKRLEAFIGWDEILKFMKTEYPTLLEVVNSCFTYSCVDHIYLILKEEQDKTKKEQYLKAIQPYTRKHYKEILKNKKLSVNYKVIVTLFNCHIKLLIMANQLKLYLKLKEKEQAV